MGGGIAPTITTPPVLAWTVEIGNSPTLTDPVYTGDTGTITWTLYRDGVADGTIAGVSKATAEAYAAAWSGTNTGVNDIGNANGVVPLVFRATVTNGSGSDSADSNAVAFDDATYLPDAVIGGSTGTLVLADSDTTVDSWESDWGGLAWTGVAPSSSRRPAYSATGGVGSNPVVTGDGSNDYLSGTLTKSSSWASMELGFAGTAGTIEPIAGRIVGYYASAGARISVLRYSPREEINAFRNDGSSTQTDDTANRDGQTGHWAARSDATNLSVMLNGAVTSSAGSAQSAAFADGGTLRLFAYAGGTSNYSKSSIQAWYCSTALTSDQRTHLRALLTGLTGIAC